MPADGTTPASIGIAQGRVVSARYGHRQGLEAFNQIFERPIEGTYASRAGRQRREAALSARSLRSRAKG